MGKDIIGRWTAHLPSSYVAYAIIFLGAGLFEGCTYTRLKAVEPDPINHGPFPDLSVMHVRASLAIVQPYDSPEEAITAAYRVCVTNVGDTTFRGTIFIGWIDTPDHVDPADFDRLGPFAPCTLAPNDSVELATSWSYPINQVTTVVRLRILTDDRLIGQNDAPRYHCGAFPIQENRYDNNESLMTLNPDSLQHE